MPSQRSPRSSGSHERASRDSNSPQRNILLVLGIAFAVLLVIALAQGLIVKKIGFGPFSVDFETNGVSQSPGPSTVSLAPAPTATVSTTPNPPPSTTNAASSPTPAGELLGTPLLGDQAPDGTVVTYGGGVYVNDTTVSLNGQKAGRALGSFCSMACDSNAEAYVVLNLGRRYSTLKARLGATDKSKSTEPVTIEAIVIDGGQQVSIYKKSFTVGQSEDVALPVSNVLQLKFVFRGPFARVYAGVGDPTAFI